MSKPKALILPESLRQQLKQPFGQLVTGSISDCNRALETATHKESPPKVVLVGDTVSRYALEAGIHADLIIVDNREMRQPSEPVSLVRRTMLKLVNPPGTIAAEAWNAISQALETGDSAVVVEGEEDLLVLVAISIAPIRSFVVYGQPKMGIVLVRVSEERKREVAQVMAQMKEIT
jgi:uncharacterized protein (UPF0218 family)